MKYFKQYSKENVVRISYAEAKVALQLAILYIKQKEGPAAVDLFFIKMA